MTTWSASGASNSATASIGSGTPVCSNACSPSAARLADLQDLEIGRAALGEQALLQTGVPLPILAAALLLAPLALHVVTASISALGARRGRRSYAVALVIAVAVHVAYNLTVVTALVG